MNKCSSIDVSKGLYMREIDVLKESNAHYRKVIVSLLEMNGTKNNQLEILKNEVSLLNRLLSPKHKEVS